MFASAMDLTSYERVRNHLDLPQENIAVRRQVLNWISVVSARVQDFLQRDLLISATPRTEYSDVLAGQMSFPVDAYPIISITSVESDQLGVFTTPIELQDFYPSSDADAIILNYPVEAGLRGIRYTYSGGLTYHATQSIFILSAVTGLVVGHYVEGQSSMAIGKVKAINTLTVTVEVLLGRFQVSEELKAYVSSDLSGGVSAFDGATITSATRRCLAEEHPMIVMATEMEIRYMKQHKLDFENTATGKEGTTRRMSSRLSNPVYEIQPEAEALIYRYKRLTV